MLTTHLPPLVWPSRRYERFEMFPYNDGVMLWNMPYMSKTNKAFIDWILTLRNGYDFGRERHGGGWGMGDGDRDCRGCRGCAVKSSK